jgi:hypothetical protein
MLRQEGLCPVYAPQILYGGATLYGFTEAHFKKADAAVAVDAKKRK